MILLAQEKILYFTYIVMIRFFKKMILLNDYFSCTSMKTLISVLNENYLLHFIGFKNMAKLCFSTLTAQFNVKPFQHGYNKSDFIRL